MHLLPANLGTLARLTGQETFRYPADSLHLTLTTEGYSCEATNGRTIACRVEGSAPDGSKYPPFPALESAPNGGVEGLIPSADWVRAFRSLPKARTLKAWPVLGNVVAVLGKDTATLGTTADLNEHAVLTSQLVVGRFPAVDKVIPSDPPRATVQVDACALAELLKVAAAFAPDCDSLVTLELRGPETPVVVRTANEGQKFQGVLATVTPPPSRR